jgi:glycosyltransferase involved in cell wall biosynthesis
VTHLTESKGVGVLLDAVRRAHEGGLGLELDLVGDGPERARYERMVEASSLAKSVRFHGKCERTAVAELMRQADFLVHPTRSETFGVVVVEALASGLPIVATRVGALRELVGDDEGILVARENAGELAGAMTAIARRLGDYAPEALRASALARFGYDHVRELWSGVYDEAVGRRDGPRASAP